MEAYRVINRQESMNSVMQYRFEEEDYARSYTLEDYYCTNPFCECDHVAISFKDCDDGRNRITFMLYFNKTHGFPAGGEPLTQTQKDIIKNFTRDLPDGLWVLFRQRYAEAKVYGEKNPASYLQFDSNRYINYCEMFPTARQTLEFNSNKTRYFVEESYDMDPRHDNKDLQLSFYKLETDKDAQPALFTYTYHFEESVREEVDAKLPPDQNALLLVLLETVPNLLNYFKERYKQVKKLGGELMKTSPKTAIAKMELHRNQMCPCGSGKKFKRCCGVSAKLN